MANLAAKEQEAATKLAALAATHDQAAAQLRQQLDESSGALEKTRTERDQVVATLDADKQELAAERDALKQQIEGKLVLEPYWQWIFGAVVALGALGWVYGRFRRSA